MFPYVIEDFLEDPVEGRLLLLGEKRIDVRNLQTNLDITAFAKVIDQSAEGGGKPEGVRT